MRISSVTITAIPVYIPLMMGLGGVLGELMDSDKLGFTIIYFGPHQENLNFS